MERDRSIVCVPMLVIAVAIGLSGCASISEKFSGTMSQMPGIGLPADVPEKPKESAAYPAVHDIPPPRNSVVLSDFEQRKMEDDLVAARDRQQTELGVKTATPKKTPPAKPKVIPVSSKVVPASSSQPIY